MRAAHVAAGPVVYGALASVLLFWGGGVLVNGVANVAGQKGPWAACAMVGLRTPHQALAIMQSTVQILIPLVSTNAIQ